jgi:hypothetical protein
MLTFFTTAKPFKGHDGIIQRNALKSWKLLHPDVEVILFGDEEGAAEVCTELGLRHEPYVERHNRKTPYANGMFAQAQQIARHEYLCYSNSDIMLFDDFLNAFEKARAWRKDFLLVSQRWDVDITEPIDFNVSECRKSLQHLAVSTGFHQIPGFVDFFLFRKAMYETMPPIVVGYAYWDQWMVWKALSGKIPVLDATPFLVPIHQNHGYNTTERTKGSTNDKTAQRNFDLAGGWKHLRHVQDGTYRMTRDGRIVRSVIRYKRNVRDVGRFLLHDVWEPVWFSILGLTRPLRTRLGMRSRSVRQSRQ